MFQPTAPVSGLRYVRVDTESLRRVDVTGFTIAFGRTIVSKMGRHAVRGLRGKIVVTYDLDSDPRPVWLIPSVRRFARKLHEAVPHLPYFLHLAPDFSQVLPMFAPLADRAALTERGADFRDPSMHKAFMRSMRAMGAFATELGEDPSDLVRLWMAELPEALMNQGLIDARKPN